MRSLLVILFSIAQFFLSCTKANKMSDTITNPPEVNTAGDTTLQFLLALGDSYTIGQAVPEADRFPVQAVKDLNRQGMNFYVPEIIARTGWTTTDLLNGIAATPPTRKSYDIVTLLIGVNNQHAMQPQQQYANEFSLLLNQAIQYAGNNQKRVIVLSIPDYSVTPYGNTPLKDTIAREIDEFNAINKGLSDKAGVHYLDITAFTRMAATHPELIAGDGLHPSAIEYKIWVDALIPVIKAALK
jgi:acyl-CoA thioesterase-1